MDADKNNDVILCQCYICSHFQLKTCDAEQWTLNSVMCGKIQRIACNEQNELMMTKRNAIFIIAQSNIWRKSV